MYPNPQATTSIAHQRQTQLLLDADQDRLARVARGASPPTATLVLPPGLLRLWFRLTHVAARREARRRAAIAASALGAR